MSKRYPVAMVIYLVLALLVWFTLEGGTIQVLNRRVDFRLIPLLVIASFAFRTWVAHKADKIRRDG